ncbi:MAG: hypothetical protein DRP96_07765 [Candidatus Neomarinimicrobiota bacterium]|nr:MAG: hypothetical protein DRP96_07765 [Candidatus Neomarinimicrobiota bacterium]
MYNSMIKSSSYKNKDDLAEHQFQQNQPLHFRFGLPGFESLREFRVINKKEIAPFAILQSLDEPRVSMIIINIKYLPVQKQIRRVLMDANRITPEKLRKIDVYVILKVSADKQRLTANAKAPLLIDWERLAGQQLVLERDDLPLEYHLNKV